MLQPKIVSIQEIAPNIVEILVYAPLEAKNFKPGMFFKLQSFHRSDHPAMESIALTGSYIQGNIISLIVLEMGGSSNLYRYLTPGDPIALMGPTGTPTEIPHNKNVVLVGGGLGNAVLLSIVDACKKQNCHVTYFAGYKTSDAVFKQEMIENLSDNVIWCCDNSIIQSNCNHAISYQGNIIQAMSHYIDYDSDHMIVIGSCNMMSAVKRFINDDRESFKERMRVVFSVNSPMQCMMKGICGKCIQKTTNDSYRFTCCNQDYDIQDVDFEFLSNRLSQDNTHEALSKAWMKTTLDSQES